MNECEKFSLFFSDFLCKMDNHFFDTQYYTGYEISQLAVFIIVKVRWIQNSPFTCHARIVVLFSSRKTALDVLRSTNMDKH